MRLSLPHFAVAALLASPVLLCGQEATLPSAPSAIAAQQETEAETNRMAFVTRSSFALPTSADRISSNQKFSAFVEQSMSPYATFSSAIAAGFRPTWNTSQYPENYASRFGHTVANQTEQGFFSKFLLPSILHQDPRYYKSTETGRVDRATYALSRVLVGRNDNGRGTFNTSEILGAVIAASLSNAYHPVRRPTPGEVSSRAAASIGTDAGINVLREFWPDIRDQLMDHGPKMLQSLVTRFGSRIQATNETPAN